MKARRLRGAIGALALCAAAAQAEITVSLNIQGSADEILGVLRHLQLMGVGTGSAGAQNSMKLNVQSTASAGVPAAPGPQAAAPLPAPPPAPAQPALQNPAVSPASTPSGAPVLLTVVVVDPEHKVDTVAAWIKDTSITVDLHDNGQNGDAVMNDGTWSATLTVPKTLPDAAYALSLTAYDAKGAPITLPPGPDGKAEPLSVNAALTVAR